MSGEKGGERGTIMHRGKEKIGRDLLSIRANKPGLRRHTKGEESWKRGHQGGKRLRNIREKLRQ